MKRKIYPMPQWLGEAPEWFLKEFRKLEPRFEEHAIQFARAYFNQFKKSKEQLIRGPDAEACMVQFKRKFGLPEWAEEYELRVEMAATERYREYLEREYHRLLIDEMLTAE